MRTASLSGWGQPHDALAVLAPDATPIDYARHSSVSAALLEIAAQAKDCDLIIGWSLGGQMAVRAIASGLIAPKVLVLIATPFQFVARPESKFGMPKALFDQFRDNYANNAQRTLQKAWESIVKGDERPKQVREHLANQDKQHLLGKDWLRWLDMLEEYDCAHLPLHHLPSTLLLHGDNDAVVRLEQSQRFAHILPQARLVTFTGCGHAPHWHDPERAIALIREMNHV